MRCMKVLVLLSSLWLLGGCNGAGQTVSVDPAPKAALHEMVVYKSPTCGCCGKWVEHMRDHGFAVEVVEAQDVAPHKARLGVPEHLGSCHTATVDGYVIEGHVPAADVHRLLVERPAAKGLAVPGMPVGSPGMEMGARRDAYSVWLFSDSAQPREFSRHGHQP